MNKAIFPLSILYLVTGCGVGVGVGSSAGNEAVISHSAPGIIYGGAIGEESSLSTLTEEEELRLKELSPSTLEHIKKREPLTLTDIEQLSHLGLAEDRIIEQIKLTKSRFVLSSHDISQLEKAGVSEKIINFMISTSTL